MSGLWLVRSLTKMPLFFDTPLSAAYDEWAKVTLDSGPYMAVSLSLLVGWFWGILAWSQCKSNMAPVMEQPQEQTTVKIAKQQVPGRAGFVKADAKKRSKKKR